MTSGFLLEIYKIASNWPPAPRAPCLLDSDKRSDKQAVGAVESTMIAIAWDSVMEAKLTVWGSCHSFQQVAIHDAQGWTRQLAPPMLSQLESLSLGEHVHAHGPITAGHPSCWHLPGTVASSSDLLGAAITLYFLIFWTQSPLARRPPPHWGNEVALLSPEQTLPLCLMASSGSWLLARVSWGRAEEMVNECKRLLLHLPHNQNARVFCEWLLTACYKQVGV